MKYVGPIRKELGFRTVFNILGPLTNPAKPEMFLLGVYDEYLVEPIAKVLASLGVRRGIVAYGRENWMKYPQMARPSSVKSGMAIIALPSFVPRILALCPARRKTSLAGRRKKMPGLRAISLAAG